MKALTISEPWASLIADELKFVENRHWSTNYRGPLLIHAGKGTQYLTRAELADLPAGCVVAVARLAACMPLAGMRSLSRSQPVHNWGITIGDILDHRYTEGPECLIIRDVKKLATPIPWKGCLGLWTPPAELVAAVEAQLGKAVA